MITMIWRQTFLFFFSKNLKVSWQEVDEALNDFQPLKERLSLGAIETFGKTDVMLQVAWEECNKSWWPYLVVVVLLVLLMVSRTSLTELFYSRRCWWRQLLMWNLYLATTRLARCILVGIFCHSGVALAARCHRRRRLVLLGCGFVCVWFSVRVEYQTGRSNNPRSPAE